MTYNVPVGSCMKDDMWGSVIDNDGSKLVVVQMDSCIEAGERVP